MSSLYRRATVVLCSCLQYRYHANDAMRRHPRASSYDWTTLFSQITWNWVWAEMAQGWHADSWRFPYASFFTWVFI